MLPSPLSFFFGILHAGGHGGVDIPVPVPNTEVKRPYADDTPDRGKVGSRRLFFVLNDPPAGKGRGEADQSGGCGRRTRVLRRDDYKEFKLSNRFSSFVRFLIPGLASTPLATSISSGWNFPTI